MGGGLLGRKRMESIVLEDIIKAYLFPDVPLRLHTILWDDRHKKVAGVNYSREFQEYIRHKEEIEQRLLEYGVTREKFLKKWNELLEKEDDGELVRLYFTGYNFSQLGREYFMSDRTVGRKIDRFIKKFFRSLFV